MAKAHLKTQATALSVTDFLARIPDEGMRAECLHLFDLMAQATKAPAKLWGANIIGFGTQICTYASGREIDWFIIGFSPRKANLSLYFMDGLQHHEKSLALLGKHKIGKSCLYIKALDDVDLDLLNTVISDSVKRVTK